MLNRYPLWKNLLIVGVVGLAILYSLANLYLPDPSIQITAASARNQAGDIQLNRAIKALDTAGITAKSTEVNGNTILLRFNNSDDQLKARELVRASISYDYVVAMADAATTPSWLSSLGGTPVSLGLDLAGGIHFLLEIDMDTYLADKAENYVENIKRELRTQDEPIRYRRLVSIDSTNFEAIFATEAQRDQARKLIDETYPEFVFSEPSEKSLKFFLTDEALKEFADYAIEQNLITIKSRVNALGVAEPLVQRQGLNRIVVQLPGMQDAAMAKGQIGQVANLEYHAVAPSDASSFDVETYGFRSEREGLRTSSLYKYVITSGSHVTNASATTDQNGAPAVSISLDSEGGTAMGDFTKKNVGNPLAVVFVEYKSKTELVNGEIKTTNYQEKKIISQATVQGVFGASFQVTGLDSMAEAAELASLLKAGAFTAPVKFVEERTIGPSLGADNIKVGILSLVVGMALVVLFMIAAYRFFGVLAVISLTVNIVLLLAILSLFGAALTLPGIAGIVLTIGMAVDANVLIFSRIREEVVAGSSPQAAINSGYQRAFVTILDANITTFLVAIILFVVGTGPVQGFAVTLSIGIMTSMFTAVMVTRALTNVAYGARKGSKKVTKLSIGAAKAIKEYNFMAMRKGAQVLSVIMLVVSIGSLAVKGLNFGLDFTGGTLIEVSYPQKVEIDGVRNQLETSGFDGAVVQYFGSETEIVIRLPQDAEASATDNVEDANDDAKVGEKVLNVLQQSNPEVELRRNEFVGPAVGEELKENGGIGMLIALIMVMIYVAVRFQFKFSVGAVAALAHDVIIVLGFFSVTGMEFDLTVLAAVLAVIGYSLNDTIVVSDRIRENFRKVHSGNAVEIINLSLSETLGRTIMTSITTALVLLAMLLMGGELIQGFAVALLVGVGIGTYSSIYVAANVLLISKLNKEDLMPPEKAEEGEELIEKPSWLKE